jgi:hypothetical protein
MDQTDNIAENEREAIEGLRAVILAFDAIPSTRFLELMQDALNSDFEDHLGC